MATRRQLEILRMMRDEDEELVYSRGIGYVGLERVGRSVLLGLLRTMAIRADSYSNLENGGCERYAINETGRAILGKAGL